MFVTDEMKQSARRCDLYSYLLSHHSQEFRREGTSLRMIRSPSLSIKKGYSGYLWFSTGERGNSIDFLTRHMGYSFTDAVQALCDCNTDRYVQAECSQGPVCQNPLNICAPPAALPPFRRAYAYLTATRKIPADTVNYLMRQGLIYQDSSYGNVVFASKARDYFELRGTLTYGKPFHGCRRKASDSYWSFGDFCTDQKTAYICEAAIDALSLYELLKLKNAPCALFCSIGGVANQAAINRIAKEYNAILAVDNDPAGRLCRNKNPSIPAIFPVSKDWNQDWQNFCASKKG